MLQALRLRRGSIAAKFYLLAALAIVAVSGLALSSIYFAKTTETAAIYLYGDAYVGVLNATRLELLLEQHRRIVESMPAEVDRVRLRNSRAQLGIVGSRLTDLISDLISHDTDSAADATERSIAESFPVLFRSGDQVAFYAYNFAQDKAYEFAAEYSTLADKTQRLVQGYHEQRLKDAESSVSRLLAAAKSLTVWVFLCTIVAFILIGPISLMIAHRVLSRLGLVTGAMAKLARNDTAITIPSRDDNDEIGQMARAVEVFKDNAHLARHDLLTNLPNRVLFREHLEKAFLTLKRDQVFAVLSVDLDRFKQVNDTLGHAFGDQLLKAVAGRLRGCVKEGDVIARLGGDEFAIVQAAVERPEQCSELASRIIEVLSETYAIDGKHVDIGTSVGIAVAPADGANPDQLLSNADMALYLATSDGRGTHRFFEAEMDKRLQARRSLELDMRSAIANGEFELYYQPIVHLETKRITGFEALLRWNHPLHGIVAPLNFISLAEETGLILPLGEWVLRTACSQAANWPEPIDVSINLSPAQFKSRNLVQIVLNALAASGLSPKRAVLEITESVFLQNEAGVVATLHQLRELGVRIAMDDFGTGYSSLSYLRSFPFDRIKIDRSFVLDMLHRDDCRAIVGAVAELARKLNMTTVVEGVETQAQFEMVTALGCDECQGYFFGYPVPESEAVKTLRRARGLASAA